MRDNTNILMIVTWVVLLSSASILLNDIREFDFNQFKEFQSWAKSANKNESWFTSKNSIQWSYYFISACLFLCRAYLIYGFSYFLSILKEVENGNYFSINIIKYFKKLGSIFIWYTINVLVLRFLLASIGKSTFNFFNELKTEFTFLIPAGLAFYILAEIFKRAKEIQEENDLTI
ncbi:DUF2975 domain-containing protein [Flavivirga amylovorans]|uniref:DUF2975 domain-containing protein n=1 Tax=Flavivirga amylovorans TaxID=870486 RepID=A0ABT8X2G2_9FLAO|nr:DUF2975 domain-containing protein [Flavivirga amylovorans]MDO5988144.1 DUF2975 domain-containing protein [Flavivirga amylovorans]